MGFFRFSYEEVCVYDEREWTSLFAYIDNRNPGWWETKGYSFHASFYGTEEIALNELKLTPEYKQFFE